MTKKRNIEKMAEENWDSGFYCAESVLVAASKTYGFESDLIPQIATAFCSGVSRTSGMCGAISGALMAIGAVKGRNKPATKVDATYKIVQEFLSEFEKKHGATNCTKLLGFDLSTKEGQAEYKRKYGESEESFCGDLTASAAGILQKVLDRHG
ncbi:MAG: C_GCAxxG_C_C family protein [Desulfobacteraceae bacterium]|nr:C_GCAxxG_C_C family protein [Desulfobacteraceae bacterium]